MNDFDGVSRVRRRNLHFEEGIEGFWGILSGEGVLRIPETDCGIDLADGKEYVENLLLFLLLLMADIDPFLECSYTCHS